MESAQFIRFTCWQPMGRCHATAKLRQYAGGSVGGWPWRENATARQRMVETWRLV